MRRKKDDSHKKQGAILFIKATHLHRHIAVSNISQCHRLNNRKGKAIPIPGEKQRQQLTLGSFLQGLVELKDAFNDAGGRDLQESASSILRTPSLPTDPFLLLLLLQLLRQ